MPVHTDIVQIFDSNGKPGMTVYSPDSQRRYSQSFFSNDVGADAQAIAWLPGNLSAFKADIIQLFNNNGRLGIIVYAPTPLGGYQLSFLSPDLGQGADAIAWLIGDTVGARTQTDVIQLFNNNGRLGMIVYSPDAQDRYSVSFSSGDMGQSSDAIAWLAGDTTGSGKTDVIQLFNSNGRLGLIVYSVNDQGAYDTSFFSNNMGQGPGAITWLMGNTTGSGKADIVQLFDNNGRLGMIVYSSLPAGGYGVTFSSGDMGQGSDAVAWLTSNTIGSSSIGKTDIIQLFNSNGRLGMTVYSSLPQGGYGVTFFSGDMGQGPGAIAWLTGKFQATTTSFADAENNIIQLFNNNGRLGMIVYSSLPQGGYGVSFSSGDMGQDADAIAWLSEVRVLLS
jgi:hypothetical protein